MSGKQHQLDALILSACRTPIGSFGGQFKDLSASDLGAVVIREAVARAADDVAARWLDLNMFDAQPLAPTLSGLPLEYRIIQLYSRDAGRREAKFSFNVGQGTQDLGFRNEVDILFTAKPTREITLHVRDENDEPTTASFLIRDSQNRVYPSLAKRLAARP